MKETEYIVVGLGIAGLTICEQLIKHDKHFIVVDAAVNASTVVSGGVINPVVLKRFTAVWMANEMLEQAVGFYKTLSEKLAIPVWQEVPVLRILTSVEEQNDWLVTSDKNALAAYLSPEIIKNSNPAIIAPLGFGKVMGSGRIFPSEVLQAYREYLQKNDRLLLEKFQYEALQEDQHGLRYKDISAKKIIFCEGAAVVHNPFFRKEYLVANKGEYIYIKAPQLQLSEMLKGPMFVIPVGNDVYKVGATYNRDGINYETTEASRVEIVSKLKKMISCEFEVVDQIAGIRPTVKDRKPLLGSLPESDKKVFFNGLGTRGILMSPYLSQLLYEALENGLPLPQEIHIKRMCT